MPRARAYDRAKEAAIEKQLSIYIELICDHMTTWEADELYSVFRPDNRSHFCEKCGRWKHRKPTAKYVMPDDVLF
jgi:nicotinamide riboside kinase